MGSIINSITKELVILNALHAFGRNPHNAATCIPQPDVSQAHATLFWAGNSWYIKDHSRNGTLLDGEHIRQSAKKLTKKHTIQFGAEKITQWRLADLEPPFSYLKPISGNKKIIKLLPCQFFPTDENPCMSIYFSKEQRWVLEKDGKLTHLEHGASIELNNEHWELIVNPVMDETVDQGNKLKHCCLVFNLSADEEHIAIHFEVSTDHLIDMGSRSYNYLLLALARKRMADQQAGYSEEEQGWLNMEELVHLISKELYKEVDAYYLNLQIFRLRKRFMEIPVFGNMLSGIVERRLGALRIGHALFKIVKAA
jgi:hypothetical protein